MRLPILTKLAAAAAISGTVFAAHLPVARSQTVEEIPTVTVDPTGTTLTLNWSTGERYPIDIQDWTIAILDSFDCATYDLVAERDLSAQRILGTPVVNPQTGDVAVPVLLEECIEVQKSAVFVVDPQGYQSHALYRLQVPGDRPLPHEFSSYALSSISGLHYWEETLLVSHGDASGAGAMMIFTASHTPAGSYAGCAVTQPGEGAGSLCP
ncbi:MAG: hypothetical protein F6K00_04470 [Leptolyngbya sp. SIOISBB]|nr:hypothetical protein [Leptolyngbya sp. SIOISBB]